MRYLAMVLALTALAGCTWETYQKADGSTALRQKYEKGARIYYQDGSYSRNMNYNQYRPEQHAVKPEMKHHQAVQGTTWGVKPSRSNPAETE
ncbi:spore cortex protein [Neisseria iguanae]|uniref:Spore cortex protein n=1 Tax=Neisseria iguanae TaxID=90242 RepID=A0A2P7TX56_9NEIS|nr:spore cortex protein [Neisseria iguanae]PSJ79322.1 spore cortex protein [Neisseria iguanae]